MEKREDKTTGVRKRKIVEQEQDKQQIQRKQRNQCARVSVHICVYEREKERVSRGE
jgi:hypothetical protein